MFNHVIMEMSLEDISAKTIGGKRVYEIGDEKYPSISTICSFRNRKSIAEWRARVGAEEANKISKRATTAGTTVHSMIEDYLNNELDIEKYDGKHLAKILFTQAKPMLARINNIHFQEAPLYSHEFAIAGRVDCIAEFDGKLSIIDFKTSNRVKSADDISSYFMQECAYAIMLKEQTGIDVDQLITIMVVDNNPNAIIFKQKRKDWEDKLRNEIKYYYDNRN